MSKQMRCFNVRVNIFFPKKEQWKEITELEKYFLISWRIPFQQPNIKNIFLAKKKQKLVRDSSNIPRRALKTRTHYSRLYGTRTRFSWILHIRKMLFIRRLTWLDLHRVCVRYSKQHLHRTYAEEAQASCLLRDLGLMTNGNLSFAALETWDGLKKVPLNVLNIICEL